MVIKTMLVLLGVSRPGVPVVLLYISMIYILYILILSSSIYNYSIGVCFCTSLSILHLFFLGIATFQCSKSAKWLST